MPTRTTIGQLLVNSGLPKELRDHGRVLDAPGVSALLQKVAQDHPEEYRAVSKHLLDVGREVSTRTGGYSFGLEDLRVPPKAMALRQKLQEQVREVLKDRSLSPQERDARVIGLGTKAQGALTDSVYAEGQAGHNPLAMQVQSGSRGNKTSLASLLTGDTLVQDHAGRVIPIPILRGYAQGLTPAQYFAGSFGARKGVIDNKLCLAQGTPVRMADGSVRAIETIQPGDRVIGCNRQGQGRPVVVIRRHDNGLRACCRYTFRRGSRTDFLELVATPDHRVLAQIRAGRSASAHRSVDEPTPLPLSQALVHPEPGRNDFQAWPFAGMEESPGKVEPPALLVGQEPVGLVLTFDLEVDHPDHLFLLAGGLVVSNSTQQGGWYTKQLVQSAHRLVVTALDEDEEGDTGTHDGDDELTTAERKAGRSPRPHPVGLPVDAADPDNEGALLAMPAGGYPRNTILTPKILQALKAKKVTTLVVRSPLVSSGPDGGLYARDVGVRERGGLSPIGDQVGMAASQAVAEPIAQGALNSKHQGGVVGQARAVSGFALLNQLIQVPKQYPGGAAHAQVDGRVAGITPAPAGGQFVSIQGQAHYVAPGFELKVKPGQQVEAGDVLSEGVPNPAQVVAHKGIGEGRRYFMKVFRQALQDSNLGAHRRNLELVSRGLINHVEMTDPYDDHQAGDIIPYDLLARHWRPREGSEIRPTASAVGHYLELPALHHSIGTKLRPSMVKELALHGIDSLTVHKEPPPFQPSMLRAMENLEHDPDWMTRMLGSNLKKGLLKGVWRGDQADPTGTSFVPALAVDPLRFNRQGLVRGFQVEHHTPRQAPALLPDSAGPLPPLSPTPELSQGPGVLKAAAGPPKATGGALPTGALPKGSGPPGNPPVPVPAPPAPMPGPAPTPTTGLGGSTGPGTPATSPTSAIRAATPPAPTPAPTPAAPAAPTPTPAPQGGVLPESADRVGLGFLRDLQPLAQHPLAKSLAPSILGFAAKPVAETFGPAGVAGAVSMLGSGGADLADLFGSNQDGLATLPTRTRYDGSALTGQELAQAGQSPEQLPPQPTPGGGRSVPSYLGSQIRTSFPDTGTEPADIEAQTQSARDTVAAQKGVDPSQVSDYELMAQLRQKEMEGKSNAFFGSLPHGLQTPSWLATQIVHPGERKGVDVKVMEDLIAPAAKGVWNKGIRPAVSRLPLVNRFVPPLAPSVVPAATAAAKTALPTAAAKAVVPAVEQAAAKVIPAAIPEAAPVVERGLAGAAPVVEQAAAKVVPKAAPGFLGRGLRMARGGAGKVWNALPYVGDALDVGDELGMLPAWAGGQREGKGVITREEAIARGDHMASQYTNPFDDPAGFTTDALGMFSLPFTGIGKLLGHQASSGHFDRSLALASGGVDRVRALVSAGAMMADTSQRMQNTMAQQRELAQTQQEADARQLEQLQGQTLTPGQEQTRQTLEARQATGQSADQTDPRGPLTAGKIVDIAANQAAHDLGTAGEAIGDTQQIYQQGGVGGVLGAYKDVALGGREFRLPLGGWVGDQRFHMPWGN